MLYRLLLVLFCFSLYASELDRVIRDPPKPEHLSEEAKKVLLYYLDHLGPENALRYFRIASFYIQLGDLETAQTTLKRALAVDPTYAPAMTQLGFISLWDKNWSQADAYFREAWAFEPCDATIAYGWLKMAIATGEDQERIADAVGSCTWKDPDILMYLAILEMRLGHLDQAEIFLRECMTLAPHYEDADVQLATLYILQGNYEAAEKIYALYPESEEALLGLARIARRKGDDALAEARYREVLKANPENREARLGLAQAQVGQLKYCQAKKQYAMLLETPAPPSENRQALWRQMMEVKSHTNFAFKEELDYTDAKEDDPGLGVPVVKDYYFTSKFTLFVPIFDRWRLDLQQHYLHQRENDILPPVGVNYSAFVNGGSLISHFFFHRDWKWDVILKGVKATGIQNANFPFKTSALFEPGTLLMYNGNWNLFVLDAHVEDQIIKNFDYLIAQLLRIDVFRGEYGLHPPVFLHPAMEVGGGRNCYHDSIHNWKQYQTAKAGIDLYIPELRTIYLFEHEKFKELTQNYFSYKKQIQHTLTVQYSQEIYSRAKFELLWDHIWQSNHKLILPVGTLIFVADNLYLIGNKFTARAEYRFQDKLRLEISGHYYRLTLPYHDWNLKGALFWQF